MVKSNLKIFPFVDCVIWSKFYLSLDAEDIMFFSTNYDFTFKFLTFWGLGDCMWC